MYLNRSFQLWRRLARGQALDVHFDLGLRAFEDKDIERLKQNRTAIALLPEGGMGSLEYLALTWRWAWLEERHEDAVETARTITELFPDDPDGMLELAQILSDLGRTPEALDVLQDSVKTRPEDPDLWFELGLVAERLGREVIRRGAFAEVWKLEHDHEPENSLLISEDELIKVVEETIERLPPMARRALQNVVIIIEDYPEEWVVAEDIADPRILGLFDGPPLPDENSVNAVIEGPARIYLFRWNIERTCRSVEEAIEQVEITVLHEIGHYLGLDEEALDYRGLS
jgi:predicted Zn-dependent protease with MMP-like domain